MFETAGASTILEPAPALVLALFLPLFGAIGARGRHAGRFAIVATGGLVAVATLLASRLAALPTARALFVRGSALARIGQLDISADLVLDGPSSALLVLASVVSLGAVLHATWTNSPARLPWIELLTFAGVLVDVADALPLVAVGFALATVAAWGLSRGQVGLLVASDAAIAVGASSLFWAAGGTFGPAGYVPDALPRFALVTATNASAPEGKATVALTTYAGALVVADDGSPLPGEPLRSPFTATLEPGTYSFRVQAGVASQDALVSHVTLSAGRAHVLAPFGPSVSIRNLRDQVRIPRPALAGERSLRSTLASRSLFGLRAASVLAALLFGGALLRLLRSSRGSAVALEAVPVLAIAFRLAPAIDVGPAFGLAVAFAGAILAARACAEADPSAAKQSTLAANVALALAVLLAGEPAAALVISVACLLAAAASTMLEHGPDDAPWLGVACAAATGVIPGAGASTGLAAAVAAVLASREAALAVTLLVTAGLSALGAFRVYGASISISSPPRRGSAVVRGLAAALALLAITSGATLGTGTSPFGGNVVPLVDEIVTGGTPTESAPRLAVAALVAAFAASVAGAIMATRRGRLAWLGAPAAALGAAADGAARVVRLLGRGVRALDRDIVEDLTAALASALLRLGAAIRRSDGRLATLGPLDRAAGAALANLDPASTGRVRARIVAGMVALLALVVLSSLLLGR